MESESSGTTDDMSFTQNAEGWDNAMSHEVTTCDHNLHHMPSVRDQQGSSDAFGIYMETAEDDVSSDNTEEGKCSRPSHLCKDPTQETLRLQNCHVSLRLSDDELPSALCYCDLNQDVRPVLQQQEQVARPPS